MLNDVNDFWYTASWGNLTLVDCKFSHLTWENITLNSNIVFLEESEWLWKELVVLCGKINGSNATECSKWPPCAWTHAPSRFRIGQWPHARRSVQSSPPLNKPLLKNDFFDIPQIQ